MLQLAIGDGVPMTGFWFAGSKHVAGAAWEYLTRFGSEAAAVYDPGS
jgi:hypothetical protein